MTAILSLLIASISWSLFDLTRKHLSQQWQPLPLAFALNLGVVPLYLLLWLGNGAVMAEVAYWPAGLTSVLLASVAAVAFVAALKSGELSRLIPVLALTPVIAALAGWVMLDEQLTLLQWLAMLITVIAIVGIQGSVQGSVHGGVKGGVKGSLHRVSGKPFLLMLLVAVCFGLVVVTDKIALQHAPMMMHGVVQGAGVSLLLGTLVLRQRPAFSGHQLVSLLPALLLFSTAVLGQWFALLNLEAGVVELVKRSIGIIGALLLGRLLFHEQITLSQVLWSILITGMIAIMLNPEMSL